jgi:phenylalanine-4-hydroxylase
MVKRRVGPDHVEVQIEEVLKKYTLGNFMDGVDNVDKNKKWADHSPEKRILRNSTGWVCWAVLISWL